MWNRTNSVHGEQKALTGSSETFFFSVQITSLRSSAPGVSYTRAIHGSQPHDCPPIRCPYLWQPSPPWHVLAWGHNGQNSLEMLHNFSENTCLMDSTILIHGVPSHFPQIHTSPKSHCHSPLEQLPFSEHENVLLEAFEQPKIGIAKALLFPKASTESSFCWCWVSLQSYGRTFPGFVWMPAEGVGHFRQWFWESCHSVNWNTCWSSVTTMQLLKFVPQI